MAHEQDCANATATPRDRCDCDCDGRFHGVPHSERGRAFFLEGEKQKAWAVSRSEAFRKPLRSASTESLPYRATDFIAAKLTEEAVNTGFTLDGLVDDITKSVTEYLAHAALSADDKRVVVHRFRTQHLFCALSVMILKALATTESAVSRLRDAVIDSLVDSVFEGSEGSVLSAAGRGTVRAALRAGFDAGVNGAKTALQWDTAVNTVRFLGILACPTADRHPRDEVNLYCVEPLAIEYLSETMQEWIKVRYRSPLPEGE